jgi:cell division protein FtsB
VRNKGRTQRSRWGVVPQAVVLVLVVGLTVVMAIQPTRQLLAQRDRIAKVSEDMEAVKESNDALKERIDRLRDPDYLEQEARRAGLVRPGETVYNVVPPSNDLRSNSKPARASRPLPVPEPSFIERFLTFVGLS